MTIDVWKKSVLPILTIAAPGFAAAEPALFTSRRLTRPGEYTDLIEGPAVDSAGTLYLVNFRSNGTIGKLSPGAMKSELFAKLPTTSIGSGKGMPRSPVAWRPRAAIDPCQPERNSIDSLRASAWTQRAVSQRRHRASQSSTVSCPLT